MRRRPHSLRWRRMHTLPAWQLLFGGRSRLRAVPCRDFRRPRRPHKRRLLGRLRELHGWQHGPCANHRPNRTLLRRGGRARRARLAGLAAFARRTPAEPAARRPCHCAACAVPADGLRGGMRRSRGRLGRRRRAALRRGNGRSLQHGGRREAVLLIESHAVKFAQAACGRANNYRATFKYSDQELIGAQVEAVEFH